MANRFWVGGAASWDATAGTKWALTSGGAGGQAVPTSADDVFLDATSGAVAVTIAATANAKSVTCTGFTGTLAGSSGITVAGSVTLVAGMTFSHNGTWTISGTGTITSAGKTFVNMTINGSVITATLADKLTISNTLTLTQGTLDAAANNVDVDIATTFNGGGVSTRVLKMGAGTWTMTGSGGSGWNITGATGLTLTAGTSTLKFSDITSSNKLLTMPSTSSPSLYNVWLAGAGIGPVLINGVFAVSNDFKVDNNWRDISIVGTLTLSGTLTTAQDSTHMTTWRGQNFGTPGTISRSSGLLQFNRSAFHDMTFSGGATFRASNSADLGGNSGIVITPPPSQLAAYQSGII